MKEEEEEEKKKSSVLEVLKGKLRVILLHICFKKQNTTYGANKWQGSLP